ncbi:polysaccharide biosynthesis/export family protein [Novosphingobium sp. Chol11]|uniref:polysaccharide biosynthesis/export family protein n=1 Tax=Novosphingobium sp. Chol11 TaxID=1385763 RepID=UPI000BE38256|nr:polysaccharide biosynthesis/export family protein [Novosphingobium sp. Chol11]
MTDELDSFVTLKNTAPAIFSHYSHFSRSFRLASAVTAICTMSACTNFNGADGPSTRAINNVDRATHAHADLGIQMIDMTSEVARQVAAAGEDTTFEETFGNGSPVGTVIGRGDVVNVSIWEAPPATLFGSSRPTIAALASSSPDTSQSFDLSDQMVDLDGRIEVPFAGSIIAAGRTPNKVAAEIVSRLAGKAHKPQVIVRITRNSAATATIVGDVNQSMRLPLSAHGERILDALASAGGTKQPTSKITLRLSRGDSNDSMALDDVIRDPRQNIILQPGDVITAMYQPFSFTALGATGRNEEIAIEAQGITLSQALGRIGGLQDQRANPQGVFIFRYEDRKALTPDAAQNAPQTANGKVPVIYKVNLRDPASFFIAQNFAIKDKDLLYVTNAPIADLQKFTALLSSIIFPAVSVGTLTR